MVLRSCVLAFAALALAGCAGGGYGGAYDYDPGGAYYDGPYYGYSDGPYDGGGFGHHSYFDGDYDRHDDNDDDDDDDRYFSPGRDVTCDRLRDVCYDQYGVSYPSTRKHLGEREANRAHKKYGDTVFLFSPKSGVTCDRRTKSCTKERWTNRLYGDAPEGAPQLRPRDKRPADAGKRVASQDQQVMPRPPKATHLKDKKERKKQMKLPADDACPPKGCPNN